MVASLTFAKAKRVGAKTSNVSKCVAVLQTVDGHRTVKVRHQSLVVLPVAHVKPREVERSVRARTGLPHAAPRGGVGCGRPWDDLIRRASLNRVCTVERVPGFVFV